MQGRLRLLLALENEYSNDLRPLLLCSGESRSASVLRHAPSGAIMFVGGLVTAGTPSPSSSAEGRGAP